MMEFDPPPPLKKKQTNVCLFSFLKVLPPMSFWTTLNAVYLCSVNHFLPSRTWMSIPSSNSLAWPRIIFSNSGIHSHSLNNNIAHCPFPKMEFRFQISWPLSSTLPHQLYPQSFGHHYHFTHWFSNRSQSDHHGSLLYQIYSLSLSPISSSSLSLPPSSSFSGCFFPPCSWIPFSFLFLFLVRGLIRGFAQLYPSFQINRLPLLLFTCLSYLYAPVLPPLKWIDQWFMDCSSTTPPSPPLFNVYPSPLVWLLSLA